MEKEEPKQDLLHKCTCLQPQTNCFSGMCSYCNRQIVKNLTTEDLKQKQETIEEAAENYTKDGTKHFMEKTNVQLGFIAGAKWQQERMYSEEEVHKIVESYQNNVENSPTHVTYDKWFEQFKKK